MRLICCIFLISSVYAFTHEECYSHGHDREVCEYMKSFSKRYKHADDFLSRYNQLQRVKHMGEGYGYTSRSDVLPSERKRNFAFGRTRFKVGKNNPMLLGVPRTYDLRNRNLVTEPKDQGDCGNCFAYAASSALEYWYARLRNLGRTPTNFNVEEITKCTSMHNRPNAGCDGGLMEYIYDYGERFATSFDSDNFDSCNGFAKSHLRVKSYDVQGIDYNSNIEKHIPALLVKYGPITVGIDSNNDYIDNYVSGTFDHSRCNQDIDHAVSIVGYTKTDYIIKNSWGPNWGENGYFKLKRGVNACGLARYVSYITGAKIENQYKRTGPYHSRHQ